MLLDFPLESVGLAADSVEPAAADNIVVDSQADIPAARNPVVVGSLVAADTRTIEEVDTPVAAGNHRAVELAYQAQRSTRPRSRSFLQAT